MIRISGRRSFEVRTPLDNIIVLLPGAMLSRAVAGILSFWPVVVTLFVFALLHRIFGWVLLSNDRFSKLIEGDKIVLFKEAKFFKRNRKRTMLNEDDIL